MRQEAGSAAWAAVAAAPPSAQPAALARMTGMALRHWYLIAGSWPRIIELAYWPTLQMLLWGFMTLYLKQHSPIIASAAGVLVCAVLLWETLVRAQLGLCITFLEEIWSRNLPILLVSPLRTWELIATLMGLSLLRTVIGMVPAILLAYWFFEVALWDLAWLLPLFCLALLLVGWSIGLFVSGIILRAGLGAESVVWMSLFILAPVSCVWYPVTVLPDWLAPFAWSLPTTPIFEAMRAFLFEGSFAFGLILQALAVSLIWLAVATGFFLWSLAWARNAGTLLQIGE